MMTPFADLRKMAPNRCFFVLDFDVETVEPMAISRDLVDETMGKTHVNEVRKSRVTVIDSQ